jgi:hypothetical protein
MSDEMNAPLRTVLFVAWPQFDPAEVAFWQRLRDHLYEQGLYLVIASTSRPPADLGVPHLGIPSIDAFRPADPSAGALTVGTFGLDAAFLLEREEICGAPAVLPAFRDSRRRALDAMVHHWSVVMTTVEPAIVVIWNGQRVAELILDAIRRAFNVPVLFVERAPIAQALFVDDRGLSSASAIARQESWPTPAAEWRARAAGVIRRIVTDAQTWWEQPESRNADRRSLRRQLDIPDASLVLLFAGQIDEDAQQYLFSPHFDRNPAAFSWFLQQLRGRDDVYVLGKQHPKSTQGDAYRRALAGSGVRGEWRTDVSIADALAVADRVVAVNSTVLYEALARELPVLALGDWLLGGRGAAYEVRDPARGRQVVDAWLTAADATAQQPIWRDCLAFLLSGSLYALVPEVEALGLHGAADLAARIRETADRSPRPALSIEQRVAGLVQATSVLADARTHDIVAWQRVYTLRAQLLNAARAARHGQRIVIWGTGAAGRLAAGAVERLGGAIDAFTSSAPGRSQFEGRPRIAPEELRQGDVLLIATLAAADIVPSLIARGFREGADFHVLDCHLLAEQTAPFAMEPRIAS